MSQQFWNPQQYQYAQAAGAQAQAQQAYQAQMAAYQQQQQQAQAQQMWMQQQAAAQSAQQYQPGFRAGGMNDYEAYAAGGYGQEEYGCDAKTAGGKHKKRHLPSALKHWNARVSSYVRRHGVTRKDAMLALKGTR